MKTDTVLTVPKLLSALLLLGSLTFGFFAWDFERAIGRLDAIDLAQNAQAITVGTLGTRVDSVEKRTDQLSSQVTDHEKRLLQKGM